MRDWLRKVRRRKGGVYAWRTRRHASSRREWGYVGETNSFTRRQRDHRGQTAYLREDGTVQRSTEKPWMDLDPICRRIIRLPWWLCWKWVLRPLETLVMLALWPRYNVKKNGWNPRRIPLSRQRAQRAARDAGLLAFRVRVRVNTIARRALQLAGVLTLLTGMVMTVWSNR